MHPVDGRGQHHPSCQTHNEGAISQQALRFPKHPFKHSAMHIERVAAFVVSRGPPEANIRGLTPMCGHVDLTMDVSSYPLYGYLEARRHPPNAAKRLNIHGRVLLGAWVSLRWSYCRV